MDIIDFTNAKPSTVWVSNDNINWVTAYNVVQVNRMNHPSLLDSQYNLLFVNGTVGAKWKHVKFSDPASLWSSPCHVPVGAAIQFKNGFYRHTITYADAGGVELGTHKKVPYDLLHQYEYSIDFCKTWKECRVEL